MTKGALYKHYTSKQAIFDSILARMAQQDAQQAQAFALPEAAYVQAPEAYGKASMVQIIAFSKAQFRYWTQDAFAAAFRRMLMLEQFRNTEMQRLYQQYLGAGPLDYVSDLLAALGFSQPRVQAAALYGPMYLLYSIYDGAADKNAVLDLAFQALDAVGNQFLAQIPK